MKKITGLVLGIVLTVAMVFGGLFPSIINAKANQETVNAYEAPAPFEEILNTNGSNNNSGSSLVLGDGKSLVMNNPDGLGTTTLFSGTNITANGTTSGKNINFNIYGKEGTVNSADVVASQQAAYLVPNNNNAWINTNFVPDEKTELEIYFMVPEGYNNFGTAHPDVAGCHASNDTNGHFGGPLLLQGGDIQFLYGAWPGNSNVLTAKNNAVWDGNNNLVAGGDGSNIRVAQNTYYHSILKTTPSGAYSYLSDGTKTYFSEGAITENIAKYTFRSLYLFAQNNGGPVNQVGVGIREVKITQDGVPSRHFIAVSRGSTEYSSTPAPSNCMVDVLTGTYYESNGGGSFSIAETNTNTDRIDITGAIGGGLHGEKLDSAPTEPNSRKKYTYVDGKGEYWAADYLEIDQEFDNGVDADAGRVRLHKLNRETIGSTLTYTTTNLDDTNPTLAGRLLSLKTSTIRTVLSNSAGAWMDGIIGPVVNYEIVLGTAGVDFVPGSHRTINVLDYISEDIFVKASSGNYATANWKATDWRVADGINEHFHISIATVTDTKISARDILFSSSNLLQRYAKKNVSDNDYSISLEVLFNDSPTSVITVTPPANNITMDIEIGGLRLQPPTTILSGAHSLKAVYNDALYNFVRWTASAGSIADDAAAETTLTAPANTPVTIGYELSPRRYAVQILGKTTNDETVTLLSSDITNGFENGEVDNKVFYNRTAPMSINLSTLAEVAGIEEEYVENSMVSGITVYHRIAGYNINDRMVTDSSLTIDSAAIIANARTGGNFIIEVVYQKKYVIDVNYKFDGYNGFTGAADYRNGWYTISSSRSPEEKFDRTVDGRAVKGHLVNEGDTSVIILSPDKRYDIVKNGVSGINTKSQIDNDRYPELLVVELDKAYSIVVSLKHKVIKIGYSLKIFDRINDTVGREIEGVAGYINGGKIGNDVAYTNTSFGVAAQTLTPNSTMLSKFNYRSMGFMIKNTSGTYVPFKDVFGDTEELTVSDNFFNNFVDANGNAQICLYVMQQYLVDFSTPGFTQTGTSFKHAELGTYTIEFVTGKYTALLDDSGNLTGKYSVDSGSEIKLEQTAGKYGKFAHFTGMNEDDTLSNDVLSFIVSGDRYVGVNFESTKLAGWIMPTIISGSGLLLVLVALAIFLVMRASNLNKQKLAREAEIRDMKRKFNISDEITKLKTGDFGNIPQAESKQQQQAKK